MRRTWNRDEVLKLLEQQRQADADRIRWAKPKSNHPDTMDGAAIIVEMNALVLAESTEEPVKRRARRAVRLYIVHVREPWLDAGKHRIVQHYVHGPDARYAVRMAAETPEKVIKVVVDGTAEEVPQEPWK